jgi:hypothetical protein
MTITHETNKVEAPGNGVATEFSFAPVTILALDHLQVIRVHADGFEETLERGVGPDAYAVIVEDLPGTGFVRFPQDESFALPVGERLIMRRILPFTQPTRLRNLGPYFARTQETSFDRATMQIQQLAEEISRAVLAPVGIEGDPQEIIQMLLDAFARARSYDFGFLQFPTPDPDVAMGKVVIARNVTVPSDFQGSHGHVDVPPAAAEWHIIMTVNDEVAGTITVDDGGEFSFATEGGAPVVLEPGDVVRFLSDPEMSPAENMVQGIAVTVFAEPE